MAVVDEENVEKAERERSRPEKPAKPAEGKVAPGGVGGALGWPGRKIAEGRAFLQDVRGELKKVTWPSRKEVYSTTLVVIATSIFFGFYLWGLDIVFSRALSLAFKRQF
ncbi:MAG: preprotein translocase subunit SecE [Betaproteobacteria bacterium]